MQEKILYILNWFKKQKVSVLKLEKALGFSNGLLGKAAKGSTTLSEYKWRKLDAYYKTKLGEGLDGALSVQTAVNTLLGTGAIRSSHGFHDITCSANPAEPMGTVGCSCEMYRRARTAESENQTLKIEFDFLNTLINGLKEEVAGLEKDANTWRLRMAQTAEALTNSPATVTTTNFNPFPAPPTEKPAESALNQDKGKEGAENGFDAKVVASYFDKEGRKTGESKPKELSPFLKARQNLKNGIK